MNPHVDAFLRYDYGGLMDLTKVGLALSSASFGFSVAFADKIIGSAKAPSAILRWMVAAFWLLICALGCCFGSLVSNRLALASLGLTWLSPEDVTWRLPLAAPHILTSEMYLALAAACYLGGLIFILRAAQKTADLRKAVESLQAVA